MKKAFIFINLAGSTFRVELTEENGKISATLAGYEKDLTASEWERARAALAKA